MSTHLIANTQTYTCIRTVYAHLHLRYTHTHVQPRWPNICGCPLPTIRLIPKQFHTAIKQAHCLTAKGGIERERAHKRVCCLCLNMLVCVCECVFMHVGVCVNRQMWEDEDKLGNEASAAWRISRSYAILDGNLNVCVCVYMWVCSCSSMSAEPSDWDHFYKVRIF